MTTNSTFTGTILLIHTSSSDTNSTHAIVIKTENKLLYFTWITDHTEQHYTDKHLGKTITFTTDDKHIEDNREICPMTLAELWHLNYQFLLPKSNYDPNWS